MRKKIIISLLFLLIFSTGSVSAFVNTEETMESNAIVCTMDYNPVCGEDKKTYSNLCHLEAASVNLLHEGECFSLSKDTYYSTVKFICDDGLIHKLGDDSSCKAKDDWIEYAKEECHSEGGLFDEFIDAEKCETKNEINKIEEKAKKLSENHMEDILSELKQLRNIVKEQQTQIKHLKRLLLGVTSITEKMQNSINNFITYGVDENTQKLGEGERAAVMYSFKKAFGRLPENENDLADAIKIANGRWPSQTDEITEEKAKTYFETIYKREADMNNPRDAAAIVIMSYGLRQRAENRNLESERKGIKIFRDIFGKNPASTEDWNIMQAITYSGATR